MERNNASSVREKITRPRYIHERRSVFQGYPIVVRSQAVAWVSPSVKVE